MNSAELIQDEKLLKKIIDNTREKYVRSPKNWNHEMIDDAIQDSLVRILDGPLVNFDKPGAYFEKMVYNRMLNMIRDAKTRAKELEYVAVGGPTSEQRRIESIRETHRRQSNK